MRNPEETADLTFFKLYLQVSGLWYGNKAGPRWLRWAQNFRLAFFIGTMVVWDYLLMLQDVDQWQEKPYTPVVIWCNIFLVSLFTYVPKATNVEEWATRMSKLLKKQREPWQVERFRELTGVTWKVAVIYGTTQTIVAALVTSTAYVFVDAVIYLFTRSPVTFYMPMALEGLLTDTNRSFQLYLLEAINGLLIVIPAAYYSGMVTLFGVSVLYISYELEMCTQRLREWDSADLTEDQQRQLLREIVEDHNEILRLAKLLEKTIAPCFLTQNSVVAIVLGNFFFLTKKAVEDGNTGIIVTQLYLESVTMFNTFIPCYFGQLLADQGEKFCSEVSKLNWYNKPLRMKREFHMILMESQKKIDINYKLNIPLNFITFSETMNKAYSLFILFDSISKERVE